MEQKKFAQIREIRGWELVKVTTARKMWGNTNYLLFLRSAAR